MAQRYEIVVAGTTSPLLEAALEGFEVSLGQTGQLRLIGNVPDQAALHGALHRLQDLQLDILEVHRVDGR